MVGYLTLIRLKCYPFHGIFWAQTVGHLVLSMHREPQQDRQDEWKPVQLSTGSSRESRCLNVFMNMMQCYRWLTVCVDVLMPLWTSQRQLSGLEKQEQQWPLEYMNGECMRYCELCLSWWICIPGPTWMRSLSAFQPRKETFLWQRSISSIFTQQFMKNSHYCVFTSWMTFVYCWLGIWLK